MTGTRASRRRWVWPVVAALGLSAVVQVGIVVMPEGWYRELRGYPPDHWQSDLLASPDHLLWSVDRVDAGVFGDLVFAQMDREKVTWLRSHLDQMRDRSEDNSILPEWSDFYDTYGTEVLGAEPDVIACFFEERAEGWPFRCVRGKRHALRTSGAQTGVRQHPLVRTGYIGLPGDIWIPYLPIWSGLALDLVVLALPWYVVFWVAGSGRRVYRRRRGRCGACGYDLAGLDGGTACPECGAVPRGREAVGVGGGEAALRSEPRG